MALNRKGEKIQGLDGDFIVSPTSRWTDTPLFEDAAKQAAKSFQASGAMLPIDIRADDVLVQEYPASNKLCFLFVRRIRGHEHYYPYVYDLPPAMVAELKTIGRWGLNH